MGERNAIQHIFSILNSAARSVELGDDCAAIPYGEYYVLVTTDMVSEKTHVSDEMRPWDLGWFIVAINLSDIAAKGGRPLGVLLSFGLPKTTSEPFLNELTQGAHECAQQFDTEIIGGDLKETTEITLCGTAVGLVEKKCFMSRRGAKPGDVVAVTGELGAAGAGYFKMKNNMKLLSDANPLVHPMPRVLEGKLLSEQQTISSAMDLSDGLSSSLYQLGKINTVGFEINKEAIPLSDELRSFQSKQRGLNSMEIALHFGGDYELLVTIPAEKFKKTRQSLYKQEVQLTGIGKTTATTDIVLVDGLDKKVLENKGYEHFKPHYF